MGVPGFSRVLETPITFWGFGKMRLTVFSLLLPKTHGNLLKSVSLPPFLRILFASGSLFSPCSSSAVYTPHTVGNWASVGTSEGSESGLGEEWRFVCNLAGWTF